MGRHRKKPYFDSSTALQEQIATVAAYFGEPYDDRLPVDKDHVTLRDVAETFEITILKARKMLITAGVYSTRLSRQVQELSSEGKPQLEIMNITRLSRASVQSSTTSVDYVLNKMKYKNNCSVRKGYFPETFENIDEKFCYVSIDCDLYKPTYDGLCRFWLHMNSGGYIMVHDYQNTNYPNTKWLFGHRRG